MLVFRCATKLLKELRVLPDSSPEASAHGFLGAWYANLVRIDRRKCLFFTNEEAFYSFLVPAVKRADMEHFGELFATHLLAHLEAEGLDDALRSARSPILQISGPQNHL